MYLICFLPVSNVQADGVLIPMPPYPHHEPIPPLSIKYHHVEVEINNQIAVTKVDQVFINEYRGDLEGEYLFPIPEGAAIEKFSMWVDGEELNGQLLAKDEARKIYEGIVRRQQDPALLEFVGRAMFRARVYPIPGNGEKRISLDYSELLTMDNGICEYRYSLNTEKYSNKPLRDAKVTVQLHSELPIKSVYSPSHDVDIIRETDHYIKITYIEENTKPDKDFLLYYTVSEKDFGLNLLTYNGEGEDGYFLAMLSPSLEVADKKSTKKNIVFVLDVSGSMSGEKLRQAKEAVNFCIDNLNREDYFNIIAFSTGTEVLHRVMMSANSANIRKAKEFVNALKARGGTAIDEALTVALEKLETKDSTAPNMILFLTDGLPTVGETNIERILKNTTASNKNVRARTFIFGVGYDVDTHLLDKLANDNHGVSSYVRPEENIEVKVSNLYEKIDNPVLTDLSINWRISAYDIYPQNLPDLFRGSQLLIVGRYKGSGHKAVELFGFSEGNKQSFSFDATFKRETTKNDYIPRLWASRKIGFLLDEIRLQGQNKELVDEVVKLSKEYGIMTPYTSFLVEEDSGDMAFDEVEEKAAMRMSDTFGTTSGAGAVHSSEGTKKMQEMNAPAPTAGYYDNKTGKIVSVKDRLKIISDKTFYLRDDVWTDSHYEKAGENGKDEETVIIEMYSAAYFQILKEYSDIGIYLSLGKVIFKVEGGFIQIDENGRSKEFSNKELNKLFGT